ncbi:hypothetical protein HMPREF1544_04784 [Mucor circinelloides 1006PhL]|uniref:MAGE domain-containing protein n=1 Tax=Mucor circinelloides f. circinelloides (strain 1006PhL) TaxID=1220926 RepID=S2JZZ3_MUCC1|nr:hypothetical protein HMPREF1544_04784 [Mucor circinelloides 1006PhL]
MPRTMKRPRMEDSSEEEYEEEATFSQRVKVQPDTVPMDQEDLDRNVKAICRYALSCEYKKKTIRREDLAKLLNEPFKRLLQLVLSRAQEKLRHVFGFEIVELPNMKEKSNQSQTQRNGGSGSTQTQTQTQQVPYKKVPGGSSGTYVLRSVLREEYRTPDIIERPAREYQLTGILYVLLSLIFINGQSMNTADLNGHMDRLKLTKTIHGVEGIRARDELISEFLKDGYLKRSKLPDPDTDEPQFTYTWGPRAMVEVGHAGISAFAISFFGDDLDEDTKQDLNRKIWKQAGYVEQK